MGSLWRIAEKASADFPVKTAFIEIGGDGEERRTDFSGFYDSVRRIASAIREAGVRDGDKVILFSENSIEWPVFWFAINASGAVAVPLDYNLSRVELETVRDDCEASACFISARQKERLFGDSAPVGVYVIGHSDDYKMYQPLEPAVTEGIAALIYTSGTTGSPKAVILEERNYLANLTSIESMGICGEKDVFLNILPFYHSFPLMVNLLLPVHCGASCVILSQIKSSVVLKTLAEKGITVLPAVPLFYKNIMDGIERKLAESGAAGNAVSRLVPLLHTVRARWRINAGPLLFKKLHSRLAPSLRYFVCGGARLDPDIFSFFHGLGFNLIEGYGLTEAAPVVALNPPGGEKAGSAGRTLPGVEVRVIPEEGFEHGELAFRGANVMKGYYKAPGLTAEMISDGWLKTGDLGYVDDDGYIFITGRKKEVIVLPNGKNIYPDEIEKAFSGIAGVEECAVIADGEGSGLTLSLAVRHAEGLDATGIAAMKESINQVSRDLPEYRRPKRIFFTSAEFPKTSLGKPKRYRIRDMCAGREQPAAAAGAVEHFDEAETKILALLKSHTGFGANFSRSLDLETELGMDSLKKIEFTVVLDESFERSFPEDFFSDLRTVGDLLDKVKRRLADEGVAGGSAARSFRELLMAEPTQEEKELIISRGLLHNKILEFLLFTCVMLLTRICYRLDHDLRPDRLGPGAFILAPNHTSFLDGPLIMAVMPWKLKRRLYFVGLTDFFGRYPLKLFRVASAVIAFDPLRESAKALRTACYVLRNGQPLCIFPEGARSPDGSLQEMKKGVAMLAAITGVPVYPVHIGGAFESWPIARMLPSVFRPVTLRFGEPLRFSDAGGDEAFLEALRNALSSLAKRVAKRVEKTREN